MTHNLNQFKTNLPCPSNRKIVVVDGTTTTVAGIGDVQVSGLFYTPYVPTGHQLADVLTKGLYSNVFHKNISKLGMEDLYSPA